MVCSVRLKGDQKGREVLRCLLLLLPTAVAAAAAAGGGRTCDLQQIWSTVWITPSGDTLQAYPPRAQQQIRLVGGILVKQRQ
jgi:hypothetical protein